MRCQSTFSILHVVLPLTLVPILLPIEELAGTMAFVTFPLTNVQVLIVIVAMASTLSQALLPVAMVLVIGPLLLVRTVEDAISISDVSSLS